MVEVKIFPDQKYAIITTSKTNCTYTLVKDNSGFVFFEFKVDRGQLPAELKGKFSSIEKGVEFFKSYERRMSQTQSAKNVELGKLRERRSAELQSENS